MLPERLHRGDQLVRQKEDECGASRLERIACPGGCYAQGLLRFVLLRLITQSPRVPRLPYPMGHGISTLLRIQCAIKPVANIYKVVRRISRQSRSSIPRQNADSKGLISSGHSIPTNMRRRTAKAQKATRTSLRRLLRRYIRRQKTPNREMPTNGDHHASQGISENPGINHGQCRSYLVAYD